MHNLKPVENSDVDPPALSLERLVRVMDEMFPGRRNVARRAVAALLARGHVLFEDAPGVGKTTLARALAAALGLEFRRIQFTSDLLPSDILGVSLFNPRTQLFETRPGPLFASVVLADEVNRAPPRTQSGLLEAMQEGQVTIDDRSHPLPRPFLVMATQNPREQHGTYPLPESQLDRFLMRLSLGYPEPADERRMLLHSADTGDPVAGVGAVLDPAGVLRLQEEVDGVHADPALIDYLMSVVHATREDDRLAGGVSPRGALAWLQASRAHALVSGRRYVVPDDLHGLAEPCLAHRLRRLGDDPEVGHAEGVLADIVAAIPVPV